MYTIYHCFNVAFRCRCFQSQSIDTIIIFPNCPWSPLSTFQWSSLFRRIHLHCSQLVTVLFAVIVILMVIDDDDGPVKKTHES